MRPQTETKYYALGGGLDIVTPALSVPPGRLIGCINYAPWYNGGYRRIDGFERYDGQPRPHLQSFTGLTLVDATGLSVSDVLTGDSSGASGTVVGISGNAVAVAQVAGAPFTDDEDLNAAAYTLDGGPIERQAPDAVTEKTWLLAAQDLYRDDIAVVPGSGEVRGIWQLDDAVYAWRNNSGGTVGVMHKASAAGWVTTGITLTSSLKFDAGGGGTQADLPIVGETITGSASGATAIVYQIFQWGGGTATDDAYGYMILTDVTNGPFIDGEKIRILGNDRADANGDSVPLVFSPGGHYRFCNHNFFGGTSTYAAYGCNGVDDAFEISGSGVVSAIVIPTLADLGGTSAPPSGKPFLIEEHRNHLFLAFPGGRVVQSVVGEPANFSGFLDAAEFGVGDEITGLTSVVGGVLVVTSERQTRGLFGKNITDWEMRTIGSQTGGKLFSAQQLDTVYALDDLGISSIARTDVFGDFVGATVSQLIQPMIATLRSGVTDSTIVRASNQYRVYFDDNSFLIMYVPSSGSTAEQRGTQTPLMTQFGFGSYPFPVQRCYNSEDETGAERSYFASTDGFVYEDGVGTNFDGELIRSYIRTTFTHLGSPSHRKRFRRADVELSSTDVLTLKVAYDLAYGSDFMSSSLVDLDSADVEQIQLLGGGGFWDIHNWDEFLWDGQNIAAARIGLGGTGENIGFLIYNESAVAQPFILQGMTVHFDKRRLQR